MGHQMQLWGPGLSFSFNLWGRFDNSRETYLNFEHWLPASCAVIKSDASVLVFCLGCRTLPMGATAAHAPMLREKRTKSR